MLPHTARRKPRNSAPVLQEGPGSPEAEISQLRYAAVLQEAMAEATDSDDADSPKVAAAAGAPAAAPRDDMPAMDAASPLCEDPPLDDMNLSIAPPLEDSARQPVSSPLPQPASPAGAGAGGDDAVAVASHACGGGKTGLTEGGQDQSLAPDAGVWCDAAGPAADTQTALQPDVMHGEVPGGPVAAGSSSRVEETVPRVQRTELQKLLADVPLPRDVPGMVDVLPGVGRKFDVPRQPTRRNARAKQRGHGDVDYVLQQLVQGNPGAGNAGGVQVWCLCPSPGVVVNAGMCFFRLYPTGMQRSTRSSGNGDSGLCYIVCTFAAWSFVAPVGMHAC